MLVSCSSVELLFNMNAKEELLQILQIEEQNRNIKLNILGIDIEYFENGYGIEATFTIKGVINDQENTVESALNKLDFEYNTYCNSKQLFGKVYCIDENFNCVWFTREKHHGHEYWKYNELPEFYNAIK